MPVGIGRSIGGNGGFGIAAEAAARRAIQEPRLGADMEVTARLDGFFHRVQRHFQTLRHEIGHVELHPAHRFGLGVDIGRDLPAAMRGGGRQRQSPVGAARGQLVAGHGDAAHFDTIGPLGNKGQRRGNGRADAVAQHGHRLHRLAGAIDAALGIKPCIDGAGTGAAAHAAVGQIEGRTAQVQEGEVTVRPIRHHHHRLVAAGGLHQAGIEIGAAIAIGGDAGQFVVVVRHKRQLDA